MAAKYANYTSAETTESPPGEQPSLSVELELARVLREQTTPRRRVMTLSEYAREKRWSDTTKRRRKAAGLPVSERPGVPDMVDANECDAWLAGEDPPRHRRQLPLRRTQ